MKRQRKITALLFAGLLLQGCAPVPREIRDLPVRPQRLNPEPPPEIFHTVQAGETVWAISRAYGVPAAEIIAVNRLGDVTDIPIGRKLRIPGADSLRTVPQEDLYGSYRTGPVLQWPVAGREILSGFGEARRTHRHAGLDIRGRRGEPVNAAAAGKVTFSSTMRGYGKTVVIDHGGGIRTLYAHNSQLLVRTGEDVEQGQPIARVGQSGNASAAHVHFEVRRDEVPVDPMKFF